MNVPGGVPEIFKRAAIAPLVHRHPQEQIGGKAERLIVKGVGENEVQRIALLLLPDHLDGQATVGVALVIAIDMGSADPVGHHAEHSHLHAEGDAVAAPGAGPAFAILDELIKNSFSLMPDQPHLVFSILKRV